MSMADEARYKPSASRKKKKSGGSGKGNRYSDSPGAGSSKISNLIVIISVIVLVGCMVVLGIHFYQIYEAKQTHNNLKVIYKKASSVQLDDLDIIDDRKDETEPPPAQSSDKNGDESQKPETPREPLKVLPAAAELLTINPDSAGYLSIPGIIDEAVVQAQNNDYYLTHNFYQNERQCGTVFADYRNVVNDYPDKMSDNIILYGHNQKDGTMFGNMDYYRYDYGYWLKNPFIYFNTNYEEGVYVIVSSFVTNTDPNDDNGNVFDYWNYINFNSKKTFEEFSKEITERSTIITGVDINENDKFLTLSTCSTEWDTARHAIVARKLRSGETTDSIDITGFSKNPNPKWPAIYYKYNGGSYIPTA